MKSADTSGFEKTGALKAWDRKISGPQGPCFVDGIPADGKYPLELQTNNPLELQTNNL